MQFIVLIYCRALKLARMIEDKWEMSQFGRTLGRNQWLIIVHLLNAIIDQTTLQDYILVINLLTARTCRSKVVFSFQISA
jgi:hypothetical protein